MPSIRAARRRILLVDDDVMIYRAIARAASDAGIHVIHAMTAADGLHLAAAQLPELILLDMSLPDLDGMQVLERLKSSAEMAWIPVVIFSARRNHDERIATFQCGAEDYIEKPFEVGMLMRRIEHQIQKGWERVRNDAPGRFDDTVPYVKRLA
jgi:DNA-binding response OmpR family regulator